MRPTLTRLNAAPISISDVTELRARSIYLTKLWTPVDYLTRKGHDGAREDYLALNLNESSSLSTVLNIAANAAIVS